MREGQHHITGRERRVETRHRTHREQKVIILCVLFSFKNSNGKNEAGRACIGSYESYVIYEPLKIMYPVNRDR
jgi:hypothetical protein